MGELTTKQIAHLRGLGQRLEPTVHLGQAGLTDALLAGLNQELDHRELVKVKLHALKEQRKQLAVQLAERGRCILVQQVGHVFVLYRRQADPARQKIQI